VKPDVRIEQAVQCLGAARQFDEVSFQRLGECVEKAPRITWRKCLVTRFAPIRAAHAGSIDSGQTPTSVARTIKSCAVRFLISVTL